MVGKMDLVRKFVKYKLKSNFGSSSMGRNPYLGSLQNNYEGQSSFFKAFTQFFCSNQLLAHDSYELSYLILTILLSISHSHLISIAYFYPILNSYLLFSNSLEKL